MRFPWGAARRVARATLAAWLALSILALAAASHDACFLGRALEPASARADAIATPTLDPAGWFARITFYRWLARVGPVIVDEKLSTADANHARYLVENDAAMIRAGHIDGSFHDENPGKRFFTVSGRRAAALSDVDAVFTEPPDAPEPGWAIEDWMAAPFYRLWMLDPALRRIGYGQYCEKGICAAALDVRSDVRGGVEARGAAEAAGRAQPDTIVRFPSAGAKIRLVAFTADEMKWPDPLTSCPGYAPPVGYPITLQLGAGTPAKLEYSQLLTQGLEAPTCGFDSSSYTNPDPVAQARARKELAHFGAIVLIPRQPLNRRAVYSVSITASGKEYRWNFETQR